MDTNEYARSTIGWLSVRFSTTAQVIAKVRLTLDSARVRGWNEIDAVQLVGATVSMKFPPHLEFAPPTAGASDLVIVAWPDGFVLERALRLSPPDWHPHAERPPVTISRTEPAAFFRFVAVP